MISASEFILVVSILSMGRVWEPGGRKVGGGGGGGVGGGHKRCYVVQSLCDVSCNSSNLSWSVLRSKLHL